MEVREGLAEKVVHEQRPEEEGDAGSEPSGESRPGTGSRDGGPEARRKHTAQCAHDTERQRGQVCVRRLPGRMRSECTRGQMPRVVVRNVVSTRVTRRVTGECSVQRW